MTEVGYGDWVCGGSDTGLLSSTCSTADDGTVYGRPTVPSGPHPSATTSQDETETASNQTDPSLSYRRELPPAYVGDDVPEDRAVVERQLKALRARRR